MAIEYLSMLMLGTLMVAFIVGIAVSTLYLVIPAIKHILEIIRKD